MLHSKKDLKAELQVQVGKFVHYLKQLRTGRAQADSFTHIPVEAYGTTMELQTLGNVAVESAVSVVVHLYDKGVAESVVEAIKKELNPGAVNEGERVRINLPAMTEEKRISTVKEMHVELEEVYRKHVRKIRQDYMQAIEKMGGVSEDEQKVSKKAIQDSIDQTMAELERLAEHKEEEIMNIGS